MIKNKYRNTKCIYKNEKFDSKAELSRYIILLSMQSSGLISGLVRQLKFDLAPSTKIGLKTKPALRYVADFGYYDHDGKWIVEDVKGMLTDVYKIKRHLMKTVHNIDIFETK